MCKYVLDNTDTCSVCTRRRLKGVYSSTVPDTTMKRFPSLPENTFCLKKLYFTCESVGCQWCLSCMRDGKCAHERESFKKKQHAYQKEQKLDKKSRCHILGHFHFSGGATEVQSLCSLNQRCSNPKFWHKQLLFSLYYTLLFSVYIYNLLEVTCHFLMQRYNTQKVQIV